MTRHSHEAHAISIKNGKLLFWALLITVSFMTVEIFGGIISGSLTLLADAGHMFADAFAIFLS
nr:cation transporter [Rickettsiaceae bacterium]